ncbi:hypothetical protein EV356DRAFT_497568 [Viridothelium virens]|uniref:Uncharacterized protein n=1 Tax=Viridothelium virens TaxID=1048519 RepID=A0A6A6HFH7_VIRVR|nr:hypothetical protein EV356DRAFT_497568 [Viridothelium virens]
MGVSLSTNSSIAPVSLASVVIGFVSFAFTVATAFRVFWSNIKTIRAAPTEVPDYLGNLKQALYEERAHLRAVRRKTRGIELYDEGGFKVLADAVKHMIRDFKRLERPFLVEDSVAYRTWWGYEDPNDFRGEKEEGIRGGDGRSRKGSRKRRSRSSYDTRDGGGHAYAGNPDGEKGRNRRGHPHEDDYYATDYRKIGLVQRYIWLKERSKVVEMLESVTRIQTRRMAKQVCELSILMADMERRGRQSNETMLNMEERLSRVVGVRRVE